MCANGNTRFSICHMAKRVGEENEENCSNTRFR